MVHVMPEHGCASLMSHVGDEGDRKISLLRRTRSYSQPERPAASLRPGAAPLTRSVARQLLKIATAAGASLGGFRVDLKLWSAWAHRPCVLTDGSGMSQVACATFLCAQYVHIDTMRAPI